MPAGKFRNVTIQMRLPMPASAEPALSMIAQWRQKDFKRALERSGWGTDTFPWVLELESEEIIGRPVAYPIIKDIAGTEVLRFGTWWRVYRSEWTSYGFQKYMERFDDFMIMMFA